MIRQKVVSKNLKSVGYENGTLEIEFITFSIYQYYNVPENIYFGLLNAVSKGTYHNTYIKDSFRYKQLR